MLVPIWFEHLRYRGSIDVTVWIVPIRGMATIRAKIAVENISKNSTYCN
jgi:hypothetical protein